MKEEEEEEKKEENKEEEENNNNNNNIINELKLLGNKEYSNGNYIEALNYFNKALEYNNKNEIIYCNRSIVYSSLNQWDNSIKDAKIAIKLAPKYEKAYYRLIKALIHLERYKEARICLIIAFNECGDSKFLKSLEKEILELTGIPVRPKPHDFDTIEELGDGNFSKIYKAIYKPTQEIYAIKTIEKMTVDRMKRRHKNIHNEILIEKRTLNKLDHPNIVLLYATFQDYGTLYYQMEYLDGGEVWSYLQDEKTKSSVGCYKSLGRFWIAEAINALEYMHRRGIVHRDVKPENMILNSHGRLKFVDFGTCKDLIATDLNGQEFVGTAEYMSPEVVDSKPSGPETDLWSLGVVIYQMMIGYTPFLAPSPYLSFLRIKRAYLRFPFFMDESVKEIISLLIQKKPKDRFNAAAITNISQSHNNENNNNNENNENDDINNISKEDETETLNKKATFSYDKLRNLAFFQEDPKFIWPDPYNKSQLPVRVPKLQEIALRAVGNACIVAAEKIASNGGSKIGLDQWIQDFQLSRLPENKRYQLLHYLNRREDAHHPAVYRLFWNSVVDARCIRSDWVDREILGFNRHTQVRFEKAYSFAYIADPLFGYSNPGSSEVQEKNLKTVVSALNKLRPKFVVISGNFTSVVRDPTAAILHSIDSHLAQTDLFRKSIARISETIPVFFVPGDIDQDIIPTPESIARYHRHYGCDYYGFWMSGVRYLVINTSVLLHPENVPDHATAQNIWLEEELEQCKLGALQVIIFSYHRWFIEHAEELDGEEHKQGHVMPKHLRDKWLPKMRHTKIKYLFTSKCPTGTNISQKLKSWERKPSKKERNQTKHNISNETSEENQVQSKDNEQDESEKNNDDNQDEKKSDGKNDNDEDNKNDEEKKNNNDEEEEHDWKEYPRNLSSTIETDTSSETSSDEEENSENEKKKADKNSPFQPDTHYYGPDQVLTPAIGTMSEGDEIIQIVEITDEEEMQLKSYSLQSLPSKLSV